MACTVCLLEEKKLYHALIWSMHKEGDATVTIDIYTITVIIHFMLDNKHLIK